MQAERLNLLRATVPASEAAEEYGINHPATVKLRNQLNELSAHITNQSDQPSHPDLISSEL